MKLLIATRGDENIKEMTNLTHPIIKHYAHKWKADFLQLDHKPDTITEDNHPHFRIMELYNTFDNYDRILSLDSDTIITPNCPNLFEEVPYDHIGTIYEDVGSRRHPRRMAIANAQRQFGNIKWASGYINTGVFLSSKIHRDIFLKINGTYYTAAGSDDVHIGYLIKKLNFKVHEWDYRYNHMTMFSEPWNNNANRFNSNIIHYAGIGRYNPKLSRIENIKEDIKTIYGDKLCQL